MEENKIILGTVNFNKEYNNTFVSKKDSLKLIDYFYNQGGRIIDTAFNYESAPVIKEWLRYNKDNELKIITKIWKVEEFWGCFDQLGVNKIYCVMARENNKSLRDYLWQQQQKGIIEKFGLSCYLPYEMTRSYYQCLEIPFDPCWLDQIDIISLYGNIYFRSVYNHYIRNYGNKDVWELINELKKNPKIDFVLGVDNLEQLKDNLEKFRCMHGKV